MSVHGELILKKGEQGGKAEDVIVASLIPWSCHRMREDFLCATKVT